MGIDIREEGRLFTLQTADTSYQMYADDRSVLLHLYYGQKIDGESLADLIVRRDVGFAGNPEEAGADRTYSLDTLPQELPSSGVGDFREDMVELEHPDGSFAADFRFESYELQTGSYAIPGMPALYDTEEEAGETLVLNMREKASGVRVKLYYGVFEKENVITRTACVENTGSEDIVLEKALSFSMDMLFGNWEMIYFAGRHAMERQPQRIPVGRAKVEIGSLRGTSSHQYNPAFLLCSPDAAEEQGECYGFCLAYSGNFTACAQMDQRGQTRVQMGIHPTQFRFVLKPGDAFFAPQAILSYSAAGFGALSGQYHDILREHMCRGAYKHQRRPVLINNWEATYFDFNEEKIAAIAAQAAELGIEMMVLDDGWFGKRDDDNSGLGDWFVNERKMNGTLGQLSEKIHALGMKFGLWFEPEMVSEDSDLYRAHPDWAIQIPGRSPMRGRNQLVLDMSRTDVREYLMERFEEILGEAQIEYVKWDMNRSICDIYSHAMPGRSGELYHRYVLGVYDLMERLLQRFPDLLIEGCSGGGGRFDAGMLYYNPQIWCSDNTDAINRLRIQYGTSFFYPPSTMGAHLSASPSHQTGRVTPFATRGDVALAGSFGYELDLCKLTPEEKEQVKAQVAEFKELYSLTHEGTYYRLTDIAGLGAGGPVGAPRENFAAWEFVEKDESRALVEFVKTDKEDNPIADHIRIRGLSDDKRYRCSLNGHVKSGRDWKRAGLTLTCFLRPYESVKIIFTEEA